MTSDEIAIWAIRFAVCGWTFAIMFFAFWLQEMGYAKKMSRFCDEYAEDMKILIGRCNELWKENQMLLSERENDDWWNGEDGR